MNRKQRRRQANLPRDAVAQPVGQWAPARGTAEGALAAAAQHCRAGELQRAAAPCREILKAQPGNADALHLLGIVMSAVGDKLTAVELLGRAVAVDPGRAEAHCNLGILLRDLGRLSAAVDACRKAIALKPDYAEAHGNLGVVLRDQGKLDEAVAALRRAAALQPGSAEAHSNLGVALYGQGQLEAAVTAFRQAIALRPGHAAAHSNLGNILRDQGKLEEAAAAYRRALAFMPDYAEAHSNLGTALKAQGEIEEAIACHRRAITLKPDFAGAHYNLANALNDQGRLDEAVSSYARAVALRPSHAEAHTNLGNALKDQGKLDEAVAAYQTALAIDPNHAQAHNNLGNALNGQGKLAAAAASYRKAIAIKPDFAGAHYNLANALKDQGKLDEAVASCRKALALKPDYVMAHSDLFYCLHFMPGTTPEEIFAEHRRWNAQHAAPLAAEIRPHANDRDPDRGVRVGFVSGSFRRHPVGYMITPAVEARDRAAWQLYVYSNGGRRSDDLTERIRAAADVWREIDGVEDDAVAKLVRDDEIDILVDLSGHAAGNRLLVFARKPAPVQVSWVGGQFNTTGMDAIDYFLTDAVETPEGTEKWFTEEVIRLPDGYVCYDPPAYATEVGPLPARERGYVTFGCFNKLAKVNEGVVALWSRLLKDLPGARLELKAHSLRDATVCARYLAMFEAHGVARERVDLLGWSPHSELLAHYNEIDIALDPFPFSGGLTTCEAMWMGVPVVAFAGETFAGRHSASHLHNVGLHDWVVETPEDYVAVAGRWSRDVKALADLRAGLRGRMAASPLCDGARFARNLDAAFRAMWRRWCEIPGRLKRGANACSESAR